MQSKSSVTFATANLFNFVEPPNAFYDFENIYERDAWHEKCRWTKEKILALDADIVGMQEVFSIEAAQALFEEMGYPYFATVDTPHIEQEYIYSDPVVAIASRYPITKVETVISLAEVMGNYSIPFTEFNRKPIFATLDVPIIGEIAVYVCHLKSQRATEGNSPENDVTFIGRWLSSQQRGWEAVMLRAFMEKQYTENPVPTLIMGDMNQPLTSDITNVLLSELDNDNRHLTLSDGWDLFTRNQETTPRSATHYHFSKGNVLDYLLLSQEFHPTSPYSLAEVSSYTVLDQHLVNPIFEHDKQASDHAFVGLTVNWLID